MRSRTKILTIAMGTFFLAASANASYIASDITTDVLIENNGQAHRWCPSTCRAILANWTGRWWITADPFSVCQCVHDCPQYVDIKRNICIPLETYDPGPTIMPTGTRVPY